MNSKNSMKVIANNIHNSTKVNIVIENFSATCFTSCQVNASILYKGVATRNVNYSLPPDDFSVSDNNGVTVIDFKDYGKFNVEICLYKGDSLLDKYTNEAFGVTADVYNIAPINDSLPVAMATLDYWGNDTLRHEGPVITNLERGQAYDWSKLPQDNNSTTNRLYGVYGCPFLSENQLKDGAFWDDIDTIDDYVKTLLELNSNSKINLITSDVAAGLINRIIYANNITNYSVKLYSDGSFTKLRFAEKFTASSINENKIVFENLIDDWKSQEEKARQTKSPTEYGMSGYDGIVSSVVIIAADKNVELLVTEKKYLNSKKDNNAFGEYVQNISGLSNFNIAKNLQANIKSSEIATTEFKNLYNFNNDYFEKAKCNNLPVMLIIGTTNDTEDLRHYANILKSYYGDKYCYYYKAHPGAASSGHIYRKKILSSLEIGNIDPSIQAELIVFFNEDIKLAGYNSSTFQSVPAGMCKAMFRMTKKTGTLSKAYDCYQSCDLWISKVTNSTSSYIKKLCVSNTENYLLEFNENVQSEQGCNFAIWDTQLSKLHSYFK